MSPNQNPWSIIIKSACVLSLIIYLSACSSGESDDDNSSGNGTGSSSKPKDTYFSLAITENSHNHVGARLLFLDFQGTTATPSSQNNIVVAPKIDIALLDSDSDGFIDDWTSIPSTTVKGLPQNNYPLSEFYDAVPTDITVGSAWDGTYVYFLVQWQDANDDRSTKFKKWIYDATAGEWITKIHVKTSNTNVINSSDTLLGKENEDRVLMMFPIIDNEGNFAALDSKSRQGLGCAAYCHPNLIDDVATQNYTGKDVAKMHTTNQSGDVADIWHWKSTRTRPSGYADDKYIDNDPTSQDGGRKADAGTAAYVTNELNAGGNPDLIPLNGINGDDILPSNGTKLYDVENTTLNGNEEVPYIISQAPDGSRADVKAVSEFNNGTWKVEFKRRLTTNDTAHDHQFTAGTNATAPTYEAIMAGVPGTLPYDYTFGGSEGDDIFIGFCDTCHLNNGIGDPTGTSWFVPRNQRASGSLIMKTLVAAEDAGPEDPGPPPSGHAMYGVLANLKTESNNLGIDIEQMVENLAAFLQEQHEAPVP